MLKLDMEVTKYVPAPDASWNKPFKTMMCEKYDAWMASGIQEYTCNGIMKAPSLEMVCSWVKDVWSSISMKSSFKSCVISVTVGGNKDSLIMCIKSGSECAAGQKVLEEKKVGESRIPILIVKYAHISNKSTGYKAKYRYNVLF